MKVDREGRVGIGASLLLLLGPGFIPAGNGEPGLDLCFWNVPPWGGAGMWGLEAELLSQEQFGLGSLLLVRDGVGPPLEQGVLDMHRLLPLGEEKMVKP